VIGEHTCEFFKRDAAMSQEACRSINVKRDHTGLNANLRRFAEQYGVNASIELFEHMVGGSG
jgi:cyclopropane fatty-acyl-phospholipid synthase-like methyltransferase